jgi:hypothetical protein
VQTTQLTDQSKMSDFNEEVSHFQLEWSPLLYPDDDMNDEDLKWHSYANWHASATWKPCTGFITLNCVVWAWLKKNPVEKGREGHSLDSSKW